MNKKPKYGRRPAAPVPVTLQVMASSVLIAGPRDIAQNPAKRSPLRQSEGAVGAREAMIPALAGDLDALIPENAQDRSKKEIATN